MKRWIAAALAVPLVLVVLCVSGLVVDAMLRGGPLENLHAPHGSWVYRCYATALMREVPLVDPIRPRPMFVDVPEDGTQLETQLLEYTSSAPRERIIAETRATLGTRFREIDRVIVATDAGTLVQIEAAP